MNPKPIRIYMPLLVLTVPLLMGQSTSSCKKTDTRPLIKLERGEDIDFTPFPWPTSTMGMYLDDVTDPIDEMCMSDHHTVCEWYGDPNRPRAFEQYGPSTNFRPDIDELPGSAYTENFVRCVNGKTYAGVCEDYPELVGSHWDHTAITVADRGVCSAKMSTDAFLGILLNQFQKQSDERLGTIRAPEGRDVALWADFVFGLKDSPVPFRAWQDHTIGKGFALTPGIFKGETRSEMVVEGNFIVDGNLEWKFDKEWIGDSTAGAALSISLQLALYSNPLTFWAVFLGNCEKDRPMRIRFRGQLEATANGGVGIRINEGNTCGPDGNGPCTWAYVYPWPSRPTCNGQIKPKIEDNFVSNIVAGMTDFETGKPRCLTCTEDGGSLLPYKLENGDPIPVRRVMMGPKDIEFVFIDDLLDPEQNEHFNYLKSKNYCNLDRKQTKPTPVSITAGGIEALNLDLTTEGGAL